MIPSTLIRIFLNDLGYQNRKVDQEKLHFFWNFRILTVFISQDFIA